MPFDSKDFVETKPDVFSLEGLIAWLETQDPSIRYDWEDCCGGCLIGMYYAAHKVPAGISYIDVFGDEWVNNYAGVCSNLVGETTFGAALERARKLASS